MFAVVSEHISSCNWELSMMNSALYFYVLAIFTGMTASSSGDSCACELHQDVSWEVLEPYNWLVTNGHFIWIKNNSPHMPFITSRSVSISVTNTFMLFMSSISQSMRYANFPS
jgi:hypothetical protein